MRKDEEKERRQLRWECVRLNPIYRETYDLCQAAETIDDDEEIFIDDGSSDDRQVESILPDEDNLWRLLDWSSTLKPPDYHVLNFDDALKKTNPGLSERKINNLFAQDIGKASVIEARLPCYLEETEYKILDGESDPWCRTVSLSFTLDASKKEVIRAVEKIFTRIALRKRFTKERKRKIKVSLLKDALKVYEEVIYKGKTLRQIALASQTSNETYEGAYNRIKKQYSCAEECVEKKAFRFI